MYNVIKYLRKKIEEENYFISFAHEPHSKSHTSMSVLQSPDGRKKPENSGWMQIVNQIRTDTLQNSFCKWENLFVFFFFAPRWREEEWKNDLHSGELEYEMRDQGGFWKFHWRIIL